MFLFSSLSYFFGLMAMMPASGAAGQLMGGFAATGYFFPFLKMTELTVGLFLVSGRFVPPALVMRSPLMLNIFAFHLFLEPKGLVVAVVLGLMQVYLAWSYRDAFTSVLQMKARPKSRRTEDETHSVESGVPAPV